MRAAAVGDVEAFGQLVSAYQQRIINLIGRMVGPREAVEDLAQEVFIKAFRKIGEFRFESSFYTWIYTIALNTCRNWYRRREPPAVDIGDERNVEVVEKAGGGEPADAVVHRKQRAEAVRSALEKLLPEQREALVMCDLEGLSYQEIAAVLGVPIGTVRSRIFRARNHLKELLSEELAGA